MEPGGFIHTSDPFATPEEQRSPVRRLRARVAAPVTLWTAPGPAGLTVSSTLVADGDPGGMLGLLDEESDLWAAIEATGRFTVCPLRLDDRQVADRFAGLLPAPGGLFREGRWRETDYGLVPDGHGTWAQRRLVGARPMGWALLVEGVIDQIEIDKAEISPLIRYRGRYYTAGQ